jgi:hypothetical protein
MAISAERLTTRSVKELHLDAAKSPFGDKLNFWSFRRVPNDTEENETAAGYCGIVLPRQQRLGS